MNNPFTYSGEVYDPETKLYYLRARYYDPSVGRFITEDTYKGQVDNPLSLNRYTYTHNNPIRNIDPTGHNTYPATNLGASFTALITAVGTVVTYIVMNDPTVQYAVPKEAPHVSETKPQLTVIKGGKSSQNNSSNKPGPNIVSSPKTNEDDNNKKQILYHYTDEKGFIGILGSMSILPSLKALRPNDARYGDGQYFTDIAPGTMNPQELSQVLFANRNQSNRAEYYFAVDVTGLSIKVENMCM